MGFFSKKPRVRLDDFCRDFYDRNILYSHPEVARLGYAQVFCDTIKCSIGKVDPRFAAVDSELLKAEMTLVRFEVFGLAWLHQQGNKRAAEQSEFTRLYLEESCRTDIWEAMQPYNKASARSSTLGRTGETATGRAYLTFINETRAAFADEWFKLGFAPLSIGRAVNRLATDVAWKQSLTAAFLMTTICENLECQLNEEAQFRLVAIIRGFYDGVTESLKAVKIEG
jgi:hypothetical protein